ncbi:head maturation protease, ClpP-related [Anaerobacillus sp. MEB173]|uniref:head maturation protease, ClpP-related n=1 Tax=Anaerobacillus sp. MEB173 TaxID=3383345 RepID=UPI003F8EFA1D
MRIPVKGVIVSNSDKWIYDWFEMESTCPNDVANALKEAKGEQVEIEVNSGGGSVWAGSEIYTLLKAYGGDVVAEIFGIAGSAASVIAMAGKVKMSPTGQIMIHNSSTWGGRGDKTIFQQTSDMLASVDEAIANAYMLKTGKSKEELLDLMSKETFMTAQKAIELGFADEIMFDDENELVASANQSTLLPKEVIDKVKNELVKAKQTDFINFHQEQGAPNNDEPLQNHSEGEKETMNLEKLKNDYPELYNQVKQEGYEEGVNAENERMKEIEDLSLPGNEDLVNKAKFEDRTTAAQLAMDIIKAQKEQGTNYLQNRQSDAEPLNSVKGSSAPENNTGNSQEEMDKEAEAIANAMNSKRGIY